MPKTEDPLQKLRIAAPCPTLWEGMAGDERVRHCTLCNLNVYNFAEMTRDEVRDLLVRKEGRVCARLYQRADGTVLTRDCPTGLRALRRRASRMAAALITALLSLTSCAFGGATSRNRNGSKFKVNIERVANPQLAVLRGVVRDMSGAALPGVSVKVHDEVLKCDLTTVTDVNGAFHVPSLADGSYRVEVVLEGMGRATREHLRLKAGEVANASVDLQMEGTNCTVLVGAIEVDPLAMRDGISTTFTQDFINKMP